MQGHLYLHVGIEFLPFSLELAKIGGLFERSDVTSQLIRLGKITLLSIQFFELGPHLKCSRGIHNKMLNILIERINYPPHNNTIINIPTGLIGI